VRRNRCLAWVGMSALAIICGCTPPPDGGVGKVSVSNVTSPNVTAPGVFGPYSCEDASPLSKLATGDIAPQAEAALDTACEAYRMQLAVIANNLANVKTAGFKRSYVVFEDQNYHQATYPGALDSAGQYSPVGVSLGTGVRVSAVRTDLSQGSLCRSGRQLDVAIEGRGFIQVLDPTGMTYYTRAGNLGKNANGDLVIASSTIGRLLEPPITIPQDATDIVISAEGIVSVRQPGNMQLTQVGQIELATFVNPEGLLRVGENLSSETDASGAAILGNPGQDGIGLLRQGFLESSNVDSARERLAWKRAARELRTLLQLADGE